MIFMKLDSTCFHLDNCTCSKFKLVLEKKKHTLTDYFIRFKGKIHSETLSTSVKKKKKETGWAE